MKRQLLRASSLALAGLLMFASAASAAQTPSTLTTTGTGMTLKVGPATLATKAAGRVSLSFTCDPIDEYGTAVSALLVDQSTVTITQAIGRTVASRSGQFRGNVTCDSSTDNRFNVFIVDSTAPFSTGSGFISAGVQAFDFNFCCTVDQAGIEAALKIGR